MKRKEADLELEMTINRMINVAHLVVVMVAVAPVLVNRTLLHRVLNREEEATQVAITLDHLGNNCHKTRT